MAEKRKATESHHEQTTEVKKQRISDDAESPTQSTTLFSQESLDKADQELKDLLKFKFPDFISGEQMGAFALAIIRNDMSEPGLNWLAKYYPDMLVKLTLMRIADHLGVLLSAALLDSRCSINIGRTTKKIAYVANEEILQTDLNTIKSYIAEILETKLQEVVINEWTAAQAMRRKLIFSIQRFSIHSADDISIDLASCQKLWRQVRENVQKGASIRDLISLHTRLPVSDFLKLFIQIKHRLENSEDWFGFAVKGLGGLANRVPQLDDLNFDGFIDRAREQIFEEQQGGRYKYAPQDMETAIEYLEDCVTEHSEVKKIIISYRQRAAFVSTCHMELMEDDAVASNGGW